jgi:hypothetical protein
MLKRDEKGFTCECGKRNDFPSYVADHWEVKLLYDCSCERQFVLYRGTIKVVSRPYSEVMDSEAFGD